MTTSQPKSPTGSAATTPTGAADRDAREDRLSSALRDNLKRRKAQQRARQGSGNPEPDGGQGSGGEAE